MVYLPTCTKKSTIHVGKYTCPMDGMGFVNEPWGFGHIGRALHFTSRQLSPLEHHCASWGRNEFSMVSLHGGVVFIGLQHSFQYNSMNYWLQAVTCRYWCLIHGWYGCSLLPRSNAFSHFYVVPEGSKNCGDERKVGACPKQRTSKTRGCENLSVSV